MLYLHAFASRQSYVPHGGNEYEFIEFENQPPTFIWLVEKEELLVYQFVNGS